jgi:hypothetical protein
MPQQGSDTIPFLAHHHKMNRRFPFAIGTAMAGGIALVLGAAPVHWLAGLLELTEGETAAFLLRRYAASASLALAIAAYAAASGVESGRALFLGFGAWFAGQGLVAVAGLVSGTAGGLIWLAVVADPLVALWFFVLARKRQPAVPSGRRP